MYIFEEHIEFFTDEKYHNLPYGTIYIVAGKLYRNWQIDVKSIVKYLNEDRHSWLKTDVVFLDKDNDLFEVKAMPTFYSSVLPTEENIDKGTCFYVATLGDNHPAHLNRVFDSYHDTLLTIFDEILDTGIFPEHLFAPKLQDTDETTRPHIEFMIDSGPTQEEQPLPKTLSRLEIKPTTYEILLPDYQKEFKFTAQVKALYVLFLLHPEGIRMKKWSEYKDKYSQLYFLFTNRSDVDKIRQSIDKLFDMYSINTLEVKKSQCNSEIRHVLHFEEEIYKYYVIEPFWARPHRIRLDRKFVTIPDNLL